MIIYFGKKREWHKHFIWLPSFFQESFVWLETVQRRWNDDLGGYEYREVNEDKDKA